MTLADSVRVKSAGSLWMFGHWMPIAWIWIGRKLGHWNEPPVAEPTLRKTPKPGSVTKLPSPVKAKFRASPPICSEPIFTVAPTEVNETRFWSAPASVSRLKLVADSVRKLPSVIVIVSTWAMKSETWPLVKTKVSRSASVSTVPSALSSVPLLVIDADTGLPGRKRRAAGGEEDRARERRLGPAKLTREVLDADAQVLEGEDAAERDRRVVAVGQRQLGLAEGEAVAVDVRPGISRRGAGRG